MSVPTLGQKLRETREARGFTLEDAGRATKIRAIRLAEIEHDVYSNCPSLAYARGFAIIYGEYLGVDVAPHLSEFDVSSTVGLDDYQYLSHKPVVKVQKEGRRIEQRGGARRSVALLSVAAVMLFIAIFGYVVYVNFQRLGDLDRLAAKQNGQLPADAQPIDAKHPPTALAAAQPMETTQPLAKPAPVAASPVPAVTTVPAAPKYFSRGTAQGLRNNVIHAPNQPRPDLLQP
jgi:cytoskeletal protein RodZ